MTIFRLILFVLFVSGLVIYFRPPSAPPEGAAPCQSCNVIIISIDSLRPDHLGLYGYERPTTPSLDSWAKDAYVFENFFSSAHLTPIGAASLHTGLYPGKNGVINFQTYLRDGVIMLAERFVDAGYKTAAIGNSPEFEIFPVLKNNFSRGYEKYAIRPSRPLIPWEDIQPWIREAREPFFLWIPIGKVHWPYGYNSPSRFTDQEYRGIFYNKLLDQSIFNNLYKNMLYETGTEQTQATPITADDFAYVIDNYDNGIVAVDEELGNFFKWLEKSGYAKNTIVIIESEHGESLGEHEYIAHYDIYDTEINIPLVMKIPGTDGGRVTQLTANVDMLPTLFELLGFGNVSGDGTSMVPLLENASAETRDAVFLVRTPLWERLVTTPGTDHFALFRKADDIERFHDSAIRTKEWKLVHRTARDAESRFSLWKFASGTMPSRSEYELYHLSEDPHEKTNVAEKFPAIVEELKPRLLEWEDASWNSLPKPSLAPDVQEYF